MRFAGEEESSSGAAKRNSTRSSPKHSSKSDMGRLWRESDAVASLVEQQIPRRCALLDNERGGGEGTRRGGWRLAKIAAALSLRDKGRGTRLGGAVPEFGDEELVGGEALLEDVEAVGLEGEAEFGEVTGAKAGGEAEGEVEEGDPEAGAEAAPS